MKMQVFAQLSDLSNRKKEKKEMSASQTAFALNLRQEARPIRMRGELFLDVFLAASAKFLLVLAQVLALSDIIRMQKCLKCCSVNQ